MSPTQCFRRNRHLCPHRSRPHVAKNARWLQQSQPAVLPQTRRVLPGEDGEGRATPIPQSLLSAAGRTRTARPSREQVHWGGPESLRSCWQKRICGGRRDRKSSNVSFSRQRDHFAQGDAETQRDGVGSSHVHRTQEGKCFVFPLADALLLHQAACTARVFLCANTKPPP